MLPQGIYPYAYIDDCEIPMKHYYLKKEDFYSNLNMEDNTDADYMHRKRVCKDFRMKGLEEYHDFQVQTDTLTVNWCIWKISKYVS